MQYLCPFVASVLKRPKNVSLIITTKISRADNWLVSYINKVYGDLYISVHFL